MAEQHCVVLMRELQALDDGTDGGAFRRAEPPILEVEIMDDGSNA